MSDYVIEMHNITKDFAGIRANDNITLNLKKGEIHALLGENGAGKSTLMKILFGLQTPDSGEIYYDEKNVHINNPNYATALGIGMVHQHFTLVGCFTALENIILGAEDTKLGFVEQKAARKKIEQLSKNYGLTVSLDTKVEDMTVGMQQRVEILKMLYRNNDVLIFDEPTAVLTPLEIEELMNIMRELAKEGKSILFISHKLNEIMAVADRCTVLRKGKYIGTVNIADTDIKQLSEMMVGHSVQLTLDKKDAEPKDIVLSVRNMKLQKVKNVSFDVRAGEIVCIAGVDGSGQTELIYGLTGLLPIKSGKISFCGKDITSKSVRQRSLAGISHIPEDRHKHGLVLDYSLEENLVLQRYFQDQFQKKGFIRFDEVRKYAESQIDKFDIRAALGAQTIVKSMSGGNQQKAIVAREMSREHDLLITVQPTRGLDVGAIEYIHNEIIKERDAGKAILLVSYELDEVMNLADRILIMFDGEIVGEFNPKEIDIKTLGLYMTGVYKDKAGEEKING